MIRIEFFVLFTQVSSLRPPPLLRAISLFKSFPLSPRHPFLAPESAMNVNNLESTVRWEQRRPRLEDRFLVI